MITTTAIIATTITEAMEENFTFNLKNLKSLIHTVFALNSHSGMLNGAPCQGWKPPWHAKDIEEE